MAAKTSGFSSLLAPGLRKVYFDEYKRRPSEYTTLFNILTSERAYEDDYELSMLGGAFPAKPEGTSIEFVDPLTGNTKRYTHTTFGLGFRITEEMYDDDLYGPMKKMSQGLAKCASNEVEYQAAGVVDNANVTTYYTGFDALALASTAHKLLSGQAAPPNLRGGMAATYANRPSTYGALGITTLQASVLRMEKTPDPDGVLCLIKPKILFISTDLRFVAKEILRSEFKPYTANNEINPMADEGLTFFVWHFLASTTMWGLIGDTNPLNFFWRRKDKFDNSDDFDSGDAKFKATHRHSQGFSDWRGFDLGNT
jgi:hypothetical protein